MENIPPNNKKIIFTGILLPIFLCGLLLPQLLSTTINSDQSSDVSLLFALKDKSLLSRLTDEYSLQKVQEIFGGNLELLATFKANASRSDFNNLRVDPKVIYAETDSAVAASLITTNDPFFTIDANAEDKQWYLPKIKIPQAWEVTRGSADVTVAIIDTGIHASHLELNDGRVVGGFDVIKNLAISANTNSDDNGHGTAVAGIIGAIPNNSKGISGVAWSVKLMPIKALEANGTGVISSVSTAIVWAADNGANIINLSLGGSGFGSDQTLNNAVSYAFNKGVLIVAAAGNDLSDHGLNLDTTPIYPVCSDGGANMILGVAATDTGDHKATFSNFGSSCIDITAPGKKILTSAYLPSEPSNNVLIYGSGTSLATPIVSAVAALVKANNPNLSNGEIRNLLLKSADNIDSLNTTSCLLASCAGLLGKGRINAAAALVPQPVVEGSLLREASTGKIYLISNNTKKLVIDFVFAQRGFLTENVVTDTGNVLSGLAEGKSLSPLDGTLIKAQNESTVYVIHEGLSRPLTYLVFVSRSFSFANVITLPDVDVNSFELGDWYWPPDGTMVLISGDPTVFVMDKSVRRPVTYFVFIQRKLSFAKVVKVTLDEFSHVPKALDNYWIAPLDGTLVKSRDDDAVYVIENGTRRALSYNAFINRNYSFKNVKTLPQAEIDVIAQGEAIL